MNSTRACDDCWMPPSENGTVNRDTNNTEIKLSGENIDSSPCHRIVQHGKFQSLSTCDGIGTSVVCNQIPPAHALLMMPPPLPPRLPSKMQPKLLPPPKPPRPCASEMSHTVTSSSENSTSTSHSTITRSNTGHTSCQTSRSTSSTSRTIDTVSSKSSTINFSSESSSHKSSSSYSSHQSSSTSSTSIIDSLGSYHSPVAESPAETRSPPVLSLKDKTKATQFVKQASSTLSSRSGSSDAVFPMPPAAVIASNSTVPPVEARPVEAQPYITKKVVDRPCIPPAPDKVDALQPVFGKAYASSSSFGGTSPMFAEKQKMIESLNGAGEARGRSSFLASSGVGQISTLLTSQEPQRKLQPTAVSVPSKGSSVSSVQSVNAGQHAAKNILEDGSRISGLSRNSLGAGCDSDAGKSSTDSASTPLSWQLIVLTPPRPRVRQTLVARRISQFNSPGSGTAVKKLATRILERPPGPEASLYGVRKSRASYVAPSPIISNRWSSHSTTQRLSPKVASDKYDTAHKIVTSDGAPHTSCKVASVLKCDDAALAPSSHSKIAAADPLYRESAILALADKTTDSTISGDDNVHAVDISASSRYKSNLKVSLKDGEKRRSQAEGCNLSLGSVEVPGALNKNCAVQKKISSLEGQSNIDEKLIITKPAADMAGSTQDVTPSAPYSMYEKYDFMRKMKIPEGTVRQMMVADGLPTPMILAYCQ